MVNTWHHLGQLGTTCKLDNPWAPIGNYMDKTIASLGTTWHNLKTEWTKYCITWNNMEAAWRQIWEDSGWSLRQHWDIFDTTLRPFFLQIRFVRSTKVIQLVFQLYQLNNSTYKATNGPLWAMISIFHALTKLCLKWGWTFSPHKRFNFVTKTTLSLWSKEAVARRPSLSGLQSTLFTGWSEICRIEISLYILGILSVGGKDTWSSLPKNGEINLIEPNQIESSVFSAIFSRPMRDECTSAL